MVAESEPEKSVSSETAGKTVRSSVDATPQTVYQTRGTGSRSSGGSVYVFRTMLLPCGFVTGKTFSFTFMEVALTETERESSFAPKAAYNFTPIKIEHAMYVITANGKKLRQKHAHKRPAQNNTKRKIRCERATCKREANIAGDNGNGYAKEQTENGKANFQHLLMEQFSTQHTDKATDRPAHAKQKKCGGKGKSKTHCGYALKSCTTLMADSTV